MSKTPTYAYRTFIWREMSSPDVAASKRFYGEVFGWSSPTCRWGSSRTR